VPIVARRFGCSRGVSEALTAYVNGYANTPPLRVRAARTGLPATCGLWTCAIATWQQLRSMSPTINWRQRTARFGARRTFQSRSVGVMQERALRGLGRELRDQTDRWHEPPTRPPTSAIQRPARRRAAGNGVRGRTAQQVTQARQVADDVQAGEHEPDDEARVVDREQLACAPSARPLGAANISRAPLANTTTVESTTIDAISRMVRLQWALFAVGRVTGVVEG
jgi:hypothetical protein